jgi:hypothetical protein
VTIAQEEILRYLVRRGTVTGVRGGDLIPYYEARHDTAAALGAARRGVPHTTGHHTTGRLHSWRRNGGLQLRRMFEAGLLRQRSISWGTPLYDVTAEGFDAVAE